MYVAHIFLISVIFLLLICNKRIEAPSSSGAATSVTSTVAKVQRTQTMRTSSRSASPRASISRASSSSSQASIASRNTLHESGLKEIDLQPLIDTIRSEATAQTFSGGNINPAIHGVKARMRALLRQATRFTAAAGVGAGLTVAVKTLSSSNNETTTIKIPTTTDPDVSDDDIENPI